MVNIILVKSDKNLFVLLLILDVIFTRCSNNISILDMVNKRTIFGEKIYLIKSN